MARYKILVVISTLGLLTVTCQAAPDSSFDLSGNNYDLSHKSGGQDRRNSGTREKEAVGATKSDRVVSNEPGGGPFCPVLSIACMAACPENDTPEALACLSLCKNIRSDCCNCAPKWTLDERRWTGKSAIAGRNWKAKDVLTVKELREWTPKTPAEICAEEATLCVETCDENGFTGTRLQDCINLCKGYLDNCCTCGVASVPASTV